MLSDLLHILIPLDTSSTVVTGQLDKEVLCGEERLQFDLNLDVLCLGILIDALQVVVLDELTGTLVVAQEVVDSLLQFSLDAGIPVDESFIVEEVLEHLSNPVKRADDGVLLQAECGTVVK